MTYHWQLRGPRSNLEVIVGVLSKDNKTFQNGGDRKKLLSGQFCPLPVGQQYWGCVCLEPCDSLRLAGLAHYIHCLLGKKIEMGV